MGEIIREMVGLDLLEMQSDPADGRAKIVRYSEHGLAVAGDGFRYLGQLERRFAEEFGEQEYEIARDVLARLVDVLDRFAAEESQASSSVGGKVG